MADLNISPQSLRTGASGLSDVVDRMAAAINQAESEIRGQGSPWGTGLIGPIIGELYEGVHDGMLEHFETNTSIISEYAEGLDNSAQTLQDLEVDIESGLVDISSELSSVWTSPGPPP